MRIKLCASTYSRASHMTLVRPRTGMLWFIALLRQKHQSPFYIVGARMLTYYPASICEHGMALNMPVWHLDRPIELKGREAGIIAGPTEFH